MLSGSVKRNVALSSGLTCQVVTPSAYPVVPGRCISPSQPCWLQLLWASSESCCQLQVTCRSSSSAGHALPFALSAITRVQTGGLSGDQQAQFIHQLGVEACLTQSSTDQPAQVRDLLLMLQLLRLLQILCLCWFACLFLVLLVVCGLGDACRVMPQYSDAGE